MEEALLHPTCANAKRKTLRALLSQNRALPTPGAFNAMAAKLIEQADFPVVYVSGAGLNNGVAGYPDIGMLTLTEMAQLSGYIARATHLPTLADVDTGFGEAMNVFRTVQLYEQEGLAGVHLEDQVFPKRCGHIAGKAVIDSDAMVQKIKAAVAAKTDPDFLIIARVDSKAVYGYDDALSRARAYLDAGAEMIFPEALNTPDEFKQFAADLRTTHPDSWLLANMTEFGKTPIIGLNDFEAWGYNIVIYPMTLFRLMTQCLKDSLAKLKADGSQDALISQMTPRAQLYTDLHYEQYTAFDASLQTSAPENIHT